MMIRDMMRPPQDEAMDMSAAQGQDTGNVAPVEGEAPGDERQLRVLMAAMKVLYDPKTSDGIVKMLQSQNPVQALAQTTIFVLRLLYNESGGSMPSDVLLGSIERIVELLGEMAEAAGVAMDDQTVAAVAQGVTQMIGQKLGGNTQPNMGSQIPNAGMQGGM